METELIKNIAKNLRKRRIEKKLSQMDVAALADIHFTYYSQIERGLRADVSVRVLKKITDTLDISLDEAFI